MLTPQGGKDVSKFVVTGSYAALEALYAQDLAELDSAVSSKNLKDVQNVTKILMDDKSAQLSENSVHPISDGDTENRWVAILFDVDGLVTSYTGNVINSNFAHLADAKLTETSFKNSLNDFQTYVKKLLGVK